MSAQVAADLRAASTVLCREGWTTECNGDIATGAYCVIDAIALAVAPGGWNENGWDSATSQRYASATQALRSHLGGRIAAWQEAPGRTADEVIAALEAAADAAEAQQ